MHQLYRFASIWILGMALILSAGTVAPVAAAPAAQIDLDDEDGIIEEEDDDDLFDEDDIDDEEIFDEDEEIVEADEEALEALHVRDLAQNLEDFTDRRVTISGDVLDVAPDFNAFMLSDDALLSGDEIAVLTHQPLRQRLSEGDPLRVTGTVRPFVRAEIEEELGFALDERLVDALEDHPVLIADSVRTEDLFEEELLDERVEADEELFDEELRADEDLFAADDTLAEELHVRDVVRNAVDLADSRVTVSGEVIGVSSDGNILILRDEGFLASDSLVVLSPRPLSRNVESVERLRVTGTLRPFAHEAIEQEVGFDLGDRLADALENRFVLLADSIHTETDEVLLAEELHEDETIVAEEESIAEELHEDELSAAESILSVSDIARNRNALFDTPVTVQDEVVASAEDFGIFLLGEGELGVFTPRPLRRSLQAGEELRVTGTLHQFQQDEIEEALGFELDENLAAPFEGYPVLIADSVRIVE